MRHTGIAIVVVLLAALVCGASPVNAAVIPVPCIIDAYTGSNDNYAADISAPVFRTFLNVRLFGSTETRAALEFDIGALPVPPGEVITDASLILYATESNALIAVHGATGDGAIDSSDFLFTNKIKTFDPVSSMPPDPPALNTVDVTGFIRAAAAGPDPYVVLQLRELFNEEMNEFVSTHSLDPAFHPRLDITTAVVPEPIGLGVIGLAMLAGKRRRK